MKLENNQYFYDIIIIGLGPSGATLARLLHKDFSVAAIDKKKTDDSSDGFQKPCGGLLASDAQKALARFHLTLPKKLLVDPQIFAVKTVDLDSGLIRHYQRFYINMDRHKFDLWMQSLISDNVTVFSDSYCKKIQKTENGYSICFCCEGEEKTIFSKYIVGADGANSFVRRNLFPNKKMHEYVSIQQWFHDKNPEAFYSCIFDSKNTDCYSWTVSKDGFFIFGGAYPKKNSRIRFENQKKALLNIGFEFGTPLKTEACLVLSPISFFDFCTGDDTAFLIGEAAGFISPSSLEGISSAINSAYYLSLVLNDGKGSLQKQYKKKTFILRLKLALKRLKCPFLFHPFFRKLVMKSKISSIDVID